MNRQEVTALLSLMSARDGRTVGRVEVEAWFEDIGQWDFDTARQAVGRHYRTSRDFMRPYDLLQGIKLIRDERLVGVDQIMPKADPDDVLAYRAELLQIREDVAAGRRPVPPAALAIEGAEIHPDVRKAIEDAGPSYEAKERERRQAARQAEETERARQLAELAPQITEETP